MTGSPVFVLGCPRSGTTLLRLMLDQHPSLAIPDESHFILPLLRRKRAWQPQELFDEVLADPRFLRWGLDPERVRRRAAAESPQGFAAVIETVFAAYAESRQKPRWGDKSPPYLTHVATLHELFPAAQFVHLIRDGREVARSLASRDWYPSTLLAAATFWRREVGKARQAGRLLAPSQYLEVRYEALVASPEAELARVCDFLGEAFSSAMLDYAAAAEQEWRRMAAEGAGRLTDHRHLNRSPTPGLRDWREGLSAGEQAALDAAAQPLLRELGYSQRRRSPGAILRVQLDQVRRLPGSIAHEVREGHRWRVRR